MERSQFGKVNAVHLRSRSPALAGAASGRGGFSLVELLVVMLLIALLLGMVSGGIMYAVRYAQGRRNAVTRLMLQTAIQTFRHEYGEWPLPHHSHPGQTDFRNDNYLVFNQLLPHHPANHRNISFVEPGRLLAVNLEVDSRERQRWSEFLKRGGLPSCTLVTTGGTPFRVRFNLDRDTVSVD